MENYSQWSTLFHLLFLDLVLHISAHVKALLQNVALLKGQNLTMSCNMDSSTQFYSWYFIHVGSNVEKVIYSEQRLNSIYDKRVQVDNSSLSLTITSIQLNDAGMYGCKKLKNAIVINERAQVIVFDSHLQCSNNNSTQLICEVTYKGNFGPVLEWTQDGPNETIAVNSTLRNGARADGSHHLTLMTNFVHETLTCQLYFKDDLRHFEVMAANIPTYTDSCNSSACCASFCGTTLKSPPSTNNYVHQTTSEATKTIIYSIAIPVGVTIVILIILVSRRISSVRTIPISNMDDIHQPDAYSSAQMEQLQRPNRLGYEEMQEHELPSDGIYIRLNPGSTSTRPIPYVNVTLREGNSEALSSMRDRPQQYLNVVIEDAECVASDEASVKRYNYENVSLQEEEGSKDDEFVA